VRGGTACFGGDLLLQQTVTQAGDQGVSYVTDTTAKPFTTTGSALVLGASTSTPGGNPSGGINGTRDFKILAGGCRLRAPGVAAMTVEQMEAIRSHYAAI
jgi:hypothetical protein